ncbi:hypothetical protein EPUS_05856 [Endocarpon pusillum Z07020]|uniref:Nucleolar protein Dnt1-like N-terminal domain-containing protein n=1 Tax=Endocarpon pusillum (strain Z07020 / HMAS-L-300199) TaxID=1263415 RepID=U1GVR9_ENDPU|nr:uncharacterized protein EPUS_05856 [Endocarpon pusillum Z07020]ERF76583.1 hypothetical protein EPUS_05856 [Endocarpon pusillum Z07020]
MVRIRVFARVIPEDVYLRDIGSSTPSRPILALENEKKLMEVIDNPEKVSIGCLVNQFRETSQRLYREPLGEIKYLKDSELDADLDPEMSIYDAFVDAGRAATSPHDQKATFKIICKVKGRYFDVRQGSVVPDLSNPQFQHPLRPPVPPFPTTNQSLGKRSRLDAFTEEASRREGSHSPSSTRRRRLDTLKEREAFERPVLSIERDVHKPHGEGSRRQGSPVVIPETQDPYLQHEAYRRQRGSEILGEDEPKSESPEVGDSIHSLPIAQQDAHDVDIPEPAPPTRRLTKTSSRISDDNQTRNKGVSAQESTSHASSSYYSPSSGSVLSTSQGRVSGGDPATASSENAGVLNGARATASFTRTRLDLAKERAVENGPVTPTSDTSRRNRSIATAQATAQTAPHRTGPSSRTSSFSYKFRRDDRARSAESEIDDTQMSPRSRRALKRPRNARNSDAGPKAISLKELSGLFHHVDENRPLIQEHKRRRKETTWDFSEHVEGLSGDEDGNTSRGEDQRQEEFHQASASNDSSEKDEAEDVAGQRAKSQSLSDITNRDSNASTERPIHYGSLNTLSLSHPAQPQAFSNEPIAGNMSENDSDKENANYEQATHPRSPRVHPRQDVNVAEAESSEAQGRERASAGSESGHGKQENNSVLKILNNEAISHGNAPAEGVASSAQHLHHDFQEQMQPSSSLPDAPPPKKRRMRKKKSRLEEEEETPKFDNHQVKGQPAVKLNARNVSGTSDNEVSVSVPASKTRDTAIPLTEPDEQLSQDLQASARASSNKPSITPKTGKVPAQKQDSWLKHGTRTADVRAPEEFSGKPLRGETEVGQGSSTVERQQGGPSDSLHQPGEAVLDNSNPVKNVSQGKSKDGKLGLGFSQSPPSKNSAFRQPNVRVEKASRKEHKENSESLPNAKGNVPFLKKSRSFDKVMSSQSWSGDTPSRPAQLEQKDHSSADHSAVQLPARKSSAPGVPRSAAGNAPVLTIASSGESGPESDSSDDASSNAGNETSRIDQKNVTNGAKIVTTDAAVPSIEILSDSSSSEAGVRLHPSKTATKSSKPHTNGPTIIPKGNNVYNINGTSIVVPPGFTLDAYLAMRSDLANQPPKPNPRNRIAGSRKSATPTLSRKDSSSTPVPVPAKVAPKKVVSKSNVKQSADSATAKDLDQSSAAPSTTKTAVKQSSKASKPKVSVQASTAVAAKKAQSGDVVSSSSSRTQRPANVSTIAKNPTAGSTSTNIKSAIAPPAKPKAPHNAISAEKPSYMKELIAQREVQRAEKTTASSFKKSGLPTPNLANGKNLLGDGDSESESETESESDSETNSSDKRFVAAKGRPTSVKGPATSTVTVDLSIRDGSPSSDEEEL